MSDVQREAEYKVPAMCVCRQRYGSDGEADPDCPTCKGSGVMHYGVVERVKKEQK